MVPPVISPLALIDNPVPVRVVLRPPSSIVISVLEEAVIVAARLLGKLEKVKNAWLKKSVSGPIKFTVSMNIPLLHFEQGYPVIRAVQMGMRDQRHGFGKNRAVERPLDPR